MTFEEYFRASVAYMVDNPDQRVGQALFNKLVEVRPDLSEQIRGTNLDPFNVQDRISHFLEWVDKNW